MTAPKLFSSTRRSALQPHSTPHSLLRRRGSSSILIPAVFMNLCFAGGHTGTSQQSWKAGGGRGGDFLEDLIIDLEVVVRPTSFYFKSAETATCLLVHLRSKLVKLSGKLAQMRSKPVTVGL